MDKLMGYWFRTQRGLPRVPGEDNNTLYRSLGAPQSHRLTQNSPLKVFSFSQRDTILTGKAVCLNKKPTAKSKKGQKQISAILEKRKLNLPLGSKSHTEVVSIFFSLDPRSVEMKEINDLRKASPVTGQ